MLSFEEFKEQIQFLDTEEKVNKFFRLITHVFNEAGVALSDPEATLSN